MILSSKATAPFLMDQSAKWTNPRITAFDMITKQFFGKINIGLSFLPKKAHMYYLSRNLFSA